MHFFNEVHELDTKTGKHEWKATVNTKKKWITN
jgi:hypothetical protein